MIKILVLIGKTASGKDTVVNNLVKKHGFKKLTTYTSRPKRKGEKDEVTYHYISEEDFKQRIKEGFFAEWKTYNTEFGVWYYGTALDDLKMADDKTVIILTPDGYRDILDKLPEKPKSIYIYANNATIKERLQKRGDDKDEAARRIKYDNEDFKGVDQLVDRIVYNNREANIDDVVTIIENILCKWRKEDERK